MKAKFNKSLIIDHLTNYKIEVTISCASQVQLVLLMNHFWSIRSKTSQKVNDC